MPSLDLTCGPSGPLIQVELGVSGPHRQVLIDAGRSPPASVQGTFLIDTGASHSAVDGELMRPLGLTPTGS